MAESVLEENEASVTGYPYLEDGSVSHQAVTLLRKEWKQVLTEGDPVIGLHIPERPGQPLSPEVVDSTLGEIEAVAEAIGYSYQGFTCHSWLMDPQVQEMVGPQSNLARFSGRFRKMTVKSPGENVFILFQTPQHGLQSGKSAGKHPAGGASNSAIWQGPQFMMCSAIL